MKGGLNEMSLGSRIDFSKIRIDGGNKNNSVIAIPPMKRNMPIFFKKPLSPDAKLGFGEVGCFDKIDKFVTTNYCLYCISWEILKLPVSMQLVSFPSLKERSLFFIDKAFDEIKKLGEPSILADAGKLITFCNPIIPKKQEFEIVFISTYKRVNNENMIVCLHLGSEGFKLVAKNFTSFNDKTVFAVNVEPKVQN